MIKCIHKQMVVMLMMIMKKNGELMERNYEIRERESVMNFGEKMWKWENEWKVMNFSIELIYISIVKN